MKILITGGASGLGRSLVTRLAADGHHQVYFTYCSHREEAERLVAIQPNCVQAFPLDFTRLSDVEIFASEILPTLQLDALVNNVYVGSPNGTYFHKTPLDHFCNAFEHNLLPTIRITQSVLTIFRKQKDGRIINILTSYLMDLPPMGFSVYSATKAYLAQLTKCWVKENQKFGITVNSVSPDYMLTQFAAVDERVVEQMAANHPLKKLLTPDEVAQVVLMLLGMSKQINGVVIPVTAAQHVNY
jgi:NAD(P)-dependent dehydrogenase (short-subunit alcohol dehydrogenase family)